MIRSVLATLLLSFFTYRSTTVHTKHIGETKQVHVTEYPMICCAPDLNVHFWFRFGINGTFLDLHGAYMCTWRNDTQKHAFQGANVTKSDYMHSGMCF